MTNAELDSHRIKKHGWRPVGSVADGPPRSRTKSESQRRNAARKFQVGAARFLALLLCLSPLLCLGQAPEPLRPAPVAPVVPTIRPQLAADVTQPSITLKTTPESPRAGTRVWITVDTVGIDEEAGLNWRLPDVTDAEGESFESAAIIDSSGRGCQVVWPEGGEYPISVETLLFEGKIVPGGEGKPDRFVPTKWQIVAGKLNLKLRGGATPDVPAPEPEDDLVLPPVPSDLSGLVQPVSASLAGHQAEAIELARVWSQIAVVVERGFGKTTPAVRQLHVDAAKYTTFGALAGKIPGLGTAVDKFLEQTVGLEGVAVDDAKRAKIVAAFRALARVAQEQAGIK